MGSEETQTEAGSGTVRAGAAREDSAGAGEASDRRAAVLVGVFFIIGTVAGIISLGLFTDPILGESDYLTGVVESENRVLVGALLELVMAVALAAMAVAVYPVLRKRSPSLALGYFGARFVEAGVYISGVVSLLVLLTLGQEYVDAGSPASSYYETIGELLLAVRDWGGHGVLDVAVFPLGALILNSVLYQARLVPRVLAGWGIVGAVLYWVAGVWVMFGLTPLSTVHVALQAPLGVQEMALAVWLIVRGFNTTAARPTSIPGTNATGR